MTLWEKIKICNLAKFQNPGQLQLRPRSAPQRDWETEQGGMAWMLYMGLHDLPCATWAKYIFTDNKKIK